MVSEKLKRAITAAVGITVGAASLFMAVRFTGILGGVVLLLASLLAVSFLRTPAIVGNLLGVSAAFAFLFAT